MWPHLLAEVPRVYVVSASGMMLPFMPREPVRERRPLPLSKVNAEEAPKDPPLLYWTYVSLPAGVPPPPPVEEMVTAPLDAEVIVMLLPAIKAEVPSMSRVWDPEKPREAETIEPWMLFA